MLHINRILFPTDFSPAAEDAFSHASHLATRYDAEIHVFNVVTPDDAGQVNPMDYLPLESAEESEELYLAGAEDVDLPASSQSQPIRAVYHKMEGSDPAESILSYTGEHDIDLVVMGTHGRRGVERLLSGSVSEEVVRRAPCPVFTVVGRKEPGPGPEIERILAPIDFSKHARLGAAYARELATAYGATLDLLHIVEDAVFPTVYGIDPLTPVLPDVHDRAREALETLVDEVVGDGPSVKLHVAAGHAARDIVDFAEDYAADLIVMATHGRTGLQRFLIGSVAEKVVRSAPCPVFTVKSFGKSLVPRRDEVEV